MVEHSMRFLVVTGTARKGRKSIHAARKISEVIQEEGHESNLFDIAEKDIPMMETRRYADPGDPPEDIEEFGQKVEKADGIILVVPEYNHSIPGALKNLLDHLYPEYEDKLFSYITVSGGGFGGVRALSHLHDITLALNGIPGPEMPISKIGEVFDEKGKLIDQEYEKRLREFAEEAAEHADRSA